MSDQPDMKIVADSVEKGLEILQKKIREDLEEERLQKLEDARSNYELNHLNKKTVLEEQFGPDSYGAHELLDRVFLISDMFDAYVLEHPSILLDSDLYITGQIIQNSLFKFYNGVSNKMSPAKLPEKVENK